jgi:hypothetical protein
MPAAPAHRACKPPRARERFEWARPPPFTWRTQQYHSRHQKCLKYLTTGGDSNHNGSSSPLRETERAATPGAFLISAQTSPHERLCVRLRTLSPRANAAEWDVSDGFLDDDKTGRRGHPGMAPWF